MQEAGCVLLTNLAHNCETNRRRILDGGGIDSVLQAMQTFPENPGVQKRSCWALLTLAGSDLMCDSIAMRGGLGAIIAAMLNCPADDHVQYYGSWALVNLLSGTERLQAFARREGVREVAEAAHACFPEHEGIQEKALEILRLLR
ncbi:serine/threonine protein kinase [Phytophthora cinnamomi]|uniref:serine/threonine protein kinase n=1 Tax=Phytophthora cinnamomi TaxID=4785 RepID=UPI0035599F1E|nr:serine/threonine protein kinase [Phytophthora cinnamomi]